MDTWKHFLQLQLPSYIAIETIIVLYKHIWRIETGYLLYNKHKIISYQVVFLLYWIIISIINNCGLKYHSYLPNIYVTNDLMMILSNVILMKYIYAAQPSDIEEIYFICTYLINIFILLKSVLKYKINTHRPPLKLIPLNRVHTTVNHRIINIPK